MAEANEVTQGEDRQSVIQLTRELAIAKLPVDKNTDGEMIDFYMRETLGLPSSNDTVSTMASVTDAAPLQAYSTDPWTSFMAKYNLIKGSFPGLTHEEHLSEVRKATLVVEGEQVFTLT